MRNAEGTSSGGGSGSSYKYPVYDVIRVRTGRPSGYSSKVILPKIKAYIQDCATNKHTPFLEEFALQLGVGEAKINRWIENHEEFADAVDVLLTHQKLELKRRALTGEYMSKIAGLILSAEHNVVERVKKELTGENGNPIQVEEVLTPEQRKEYSRIITSFFEKTYSKPHDQ